MGVVVAPAAAPRPRVSIRSPTSKALSIHSVRTAGSGDGFVAVGVPGWFMRRQLASRACGDHGRNMTGGEEHNPGTKLANTASSA
jgi:hypothetical protein